ncbi:MAG: AAA family ATPase [Clostridia bacterium]|nr:AAA family ATPase [Clostridia bacterium]
MITDQKEWKFEEERLKRIYDIIQKELTRRQEEIKTCRDEMIASRKEMWENVSSVPQQFEEMIEAQQHIDELKRGWEKYQFAHNLVARMEKIALSPYFARVDFEEDGCSGVEAIYIGALSLIDDKTREIYIYDWRAPISSIFYDYETGPAKYKCLEGDIHGNIVLKRQFRIFRDKIEYMFDSSLKIDDEILQRILSKNADDKMRNIVATIQREQNTVIRNEENKVLIVQGAAGSGKTSIALHRAAYLLYRYRNEKIHSKNIVIFSPNQIFNDYISDVLPELGEENISQTTFLDFAKPLVGSGFRYEDLSDQTELLLEKEGNRARLDLKRESIRLKASGSFLEVLNEYVDLLIRRYSEFEDIVYKGKKIVSREELIQLFNNEYKNLPLARRLAKIRDRIYFLLAPFEKQEMKETQGELESEGNHKGEVETFSRIVTSKKFKGIRDKIDEMTALDSFRLYYDLYAKEGLLQKVFKECCAYVKSAEIRNYTMEKLDLGMVPYEDLAPILYLKGELEGVAPSMEVRHVIIDESQDYSIIQHEVFKQYFRQCSLTLLGDISQSIYLHSTGSCDTIAGVFREMNPQVVCLTKSYRSTKEIMEFSKDIKKMRDAFEPINRSGDKPFLIHSENEKELFEKVEREAEKLQEEGLKSIAILCKSAKESKKVYGVLKQKMELNLVTKDDDEFKKGIVVIPSYLAKGLEFDGVLVFNGGKENYSREYDRNLFYVACTRALHKLNIYYTGEPSPFVSEMDRELYVRV